MQREYRERKKLKEVSMWKRKQNGKKILSKKLKMYSKTS